MAFASCPQSYNILWASPTPSKTWSDPLMGWTLKASKVVGPKIQVEIDTSVSNSD